MPVDSPARVFVVDDDTGLLRLLTKALQREGYSVAEAGSGKEALEKLSRDGADLLLLDLKLHDIDGKQLLVRLADAGRSIPFIVMTGQGDERVAVEMMKRGALNYLVKDTDFLQLVPEMVRRALEQLAQVRKLAEAEEQRKQLEKQVLEAAARAQRRIGQDLHDGVGQQLTAIEFICESLRSRLATISPDLEKQAAGICEYLRQAIAQTRSLAHGLVAFHVEAGGLEAALRELADAITKATGVTCRVHSPREVTLDDSEVATQLYRIAQEAINNAVKHGDATEISIELAVRSGSLRLEVADNGKGMDGAAVGKAGIGLQVMKYRAGMIGAQCDIVSATRGVLVSCHLPLKQ